MGVALFMYKDNKASENAKSFDFGWGEVLLVRLYLQCLAVCNKPLAQT